MTQQDQIVPIPPKRMGYFGGAGNMLLPSPATLAAVIAKIPPGKVMTTDVLRDKLTRQFKVRGTCPVATLRSLLALAGNAGDVVPYWRVIAQNGQLFAKFPGGTAGHGERLAQEGVQLDTMAKVPKVRQYQASLASID
jgi:alkylated DNA nucleotide flippase Atl1